MRRTSEERRLRRLRLLRHQRTAVSVTRSGEAPGHVIAEERNRRRVAAIAHCERAAVAGRVRRVGERGVRAEGDVRQVDAVPREGPRTRRHDAAAIGHCRVDDLHLAVAVGLGAEVC